MRLADPVPGLVIRYAYLWFSEVAAGREEGEKDRPCAVVAAIRSTASDEQRVLVLPITRRPPEPQRNGIEIPPRVKERLGLDAERSWVIVSEWNEFTWPGPDLRRVPGPGPATVAYGMLPPRLFAEIRDRFLALAQAGAGKPVRRTE